MYSEDISMAALTISLLTLTMEGKGLEVKPSRKWNWDFHQGKKGREGKKGAEGRKREGRSGLKGIFSLSDTK